MNNKFKIFSLTFTTLLFLTACGSASSDAKKVDITPVKVKTEAAAKDVAENITKATEKVEEAVEQKKEEAQSEFISGVHYVEIFPEMQTDVADGKVEVVELMWLGCPHCYTIEPTMLKYKKDHPAYVEFQQVPAMLNPSWAADAKTYYLAEVLDPKGEKDLITQVFQAIHDQKRRLRNPDAVNRFFVQLGYSEEEIAKARASMLFRIKLKRAQEISAASQAQSVPTVIINGKYRTSPYIAGGEENLMKIIDMLTRKEKK